jgi:hypothetical protein
VPSRNVSPHLHVLHHRAVNSSDQRPDAAAVWVQGYLTQDLAAPATGGPAMGGLEPDLLPKERNEKPHVCLQQLLELSRGLHPCKAAESDSVEPRCACLDQASPRAYACRFSRAECCLLAIF